MKLAESIRARRVARRFERLGLVFLVGWFSLAGAALASDLLPAPPDVDAKSLARRADDALRSDRTYTAGRMTVRSPRLSSARSVAFHSWEDRPGRQSFIRILEPTKDAGTGFLMQHPNLWMYIPRVERTMRIPPSMMLQSWMGSDFTNDDLVRGSSTVEDYDHVLLGIDPTPPGGEGRHAYLLEYRPHEDAPVVWDRILAWIEVERFVPIRQEFFDEAGEKLRELRFEDVRPVKGRFVPHRWTLTPLDKAGHLSVVEIHELVLDADFADDIFTPRNLKRVR